MQVGADWPAYGGTYNAQRYSPLDQINRETVRRLERAFTFRTGDMPKKRWGAETTPLKIGDTLPDRPQAPHAAHQDLAQGGLPRGGEGPARHRRQAGIHLALRRPGSARAI
jgi:hypothetical protein